MCVCVCVCMYVYIYIYIYIYLFLGVCIWAFFLMCMHIYIYIQMYTHTPRKRLKFYIVLVIRVFTNGLADRGLIPSWFIPKKWYLIPPCLMYISKVKWSSPGKGVAIEKGAFGSPLNTVANFTFFSYIPQEKSWYIYEPVSWSLSLYIYIYIYIYMYVRVCLNFKIANWLDSILKSLLQERQNTCLF